MFYHDKYVLLLVLNVFSFVYQSVCPVSVLRWAENHAVFPSCREARCWDLHFWRAFWPAIWWPNFAPLPSWECCWEPLLACTRHRTMKCPILKGQWKSIWTVWKKDPSNLGWLLLLPVTQQAREEEILLQLLSCQWLVTDQPQDFCVDWTGISLSFLFYLHFCFKVR